MKVATIRKATQADIDELVEIWYKASEIAHDFISKIYWHKNKEAMKTKFLPSSEVYVATIESTIIGFIALMNDYLAAIFVLPKFQRQGVGSTLIEHAKNIRNKLELSVYKKNDNSINFYKSKGFLFVSEAIDKNTGEIEIIMKWHNNKAKTKIIYK
ncbi:GNAT family N-acetyltransferase [Bacteroidales bacterium OttesenSCG-928-I21]|nr:GNAT family N-acetyltransferase [Bacteroidales bacterium OttesenSCG-928-I21]